MDLSQFYTRRNSTNESKAEVIVQDGNQSVDDFTYIGKGNDSENQDKDIALSVESIETPIIGFLFSVSHLATGEYWVLRLGDTVVGNGDETDIELKEKTVSYIHATICATKEEDKPKVIIFDNQSEEGTFVNGQLVAETGTVCYNGDILTFGKHYQLLLLLADVHKYGLEPINGFQSNISDEIVEATDNNSGYGTLSLNVDNVITSDETHII